MSEPLFTPKWCDFAVQAFNSDLDARAALDGWKGDVGLVIDDSPALILLIEAPTARVLTLPKIVTIEQLEASAPTYRAGASRDTWAALIDGALDPIAAIVQKRLRVTGDVQQLVTRLKFRGLAQRWLARIRGGPS